uniref:DNA 5'-3' helicase n=1 Tax=Osmundaria fimbriata TaxID=228265 RepID=A0A1Z1M4C6_OSMFI|nr:Replication helicase subunit [Osmundaria fimbriata]ARW60918.1 Replication helicase subunit [Osmundaria fimbriata]
MHKNKFLPQNYLAEEILLGIILIYPNTFCHFINIIKEEFFFIESHRLIYINITILYKHQNINIIDLFYHLQYKRLLEKIGGLKKILNIMKQSQVFIFSTGINTYTQEIINLINFTYTRRLIVQYGHNIIKLGYITSIDNQYIHSKLKSYLNWIQIELKRYLISYNNILNIKDLISRTLVEIKYKSTEIIQSNQLIKSGFRDLDKIIYELPGGNLIIIAGRPSIGKTSLAINIAYNALYNNNINICIFSLEMSSKDILNKFISIASESNINKQTINKLSKEQWKKITQLCYKLLKHDIYINDNCNASIGYIEEIAKSLRKNENVQLIIIDYLQLIDFSRKSEIKNSNYNRSQELGYITRKLKLLAQLLQLPIIVLSQLNRNIETRTNKEPVLSDLKESGCIDCRNNISISNNDINITNIEKKYNNPLIISRINQYKVKVRKSNYPVKSVYLYKQYIFKCKIKVRSILLTHNHKYLSASKWVKVHQVKKLTKINNISISQMLINNTSERSINYIKQIDEITLSSYLKSYDINQESEFSIISKNIILHNSIEQDADIIMMLHEKEYNQEVKNYTKILEIKIAKNRNGITGSCQLKLITDQLRFQNIY